MKTIYVARCIGCREDVFADEPKDTPCDCGVWTFGSEFKKEEVADITKEIIKPHSIDASGNCNQGCC